MEITESNFKEVLLNLNNYSTEKLLSLSKEFSKRRDRLHQIIVSEIGMLLYYRGIIKIDF